MNGSHDDKITHEHRNKLLIKARGSNIDSDNEEKEFNAFQKAQQIVEETDNVTVQMVEKEIMKLNKGQFSQMPSQKQIQGYITAKKNNNTDIKKDELTIYQNFRFDNSEKIIKGISLFEGKKSITFGMQFFLEQATDINNPITQFFSDSSFRTPEQDQHIKKDRRLKVDGKWYQYDVLSRKCPKTQMILPLFFSLMGGKEEQDYIHQFKYYKRLAKDYTGRSLKLVNIKQDYELARKKAWEKIVIKMDVDGVEVKMNPQTEACTLHFMINSKKKMHQVMKGAFKTENRKQTWEVLFLVSCLQYINPNHIPQTFQQIKKYIQQETDKYDQYFDYIQNTYVDQDTQIYEYSFWNYYDQLKDKNFRMRTKFANIDIENFFLQMAKLMNFVKNPSPNVWITTVKDICQLKLKHWLDYTTNPNQRKHVSRKYKGDMYLQAESPFTRKFINKMMKYRKNLFGDNSDDINIPEIKKILESFDEKTLENINSLPYFDGDLDEDEKEQKVDNKMEIEAEVEMEEDDNSKKQQTQKKSNLKQKKKVSKKVTKHSYAAEDKDITSGFSSDTSDQESVEKQDVFQSKHLWIVSKNEENFNVYLTMKPGKCLCQENEVIRKSYNFQKPYRTCKTQKCKHFKWMPTFLNEQLKEQQPWLFNNDLAKVVQKGRKFESIKEDENEDNSSMEIEEEQPHKKTFVTPYQQNKKKNALKKNKQQIKYLMDDYDQ